MTFLTTFVESAADIQKNTLKVFVTDEQFRKPLASIIDAQTALAKESIKTAQGFVGKLKLAN
jgi:hypothetical protein